MRVFLLLSLLGAVSSFQVAAPLAMRRAAAPSSVIMKAPVEEKKGTRSLPSITHYLRAHMRLGEGAACHVET